MLCYFSAIMQLHKIGSCHVCHTPVFSLYEKEAWLKLSFEPQFGNNDLIGRQAKTSEFLKKSLTLSVQSNAIMNIHEGVIKPLPLSFKSTALSDYRHARKQRWTKHDCTFVKTLITNKSLKAMSTSTTDWPYHHAICMINYLKQRFSKLILKRKEKKTSQERSLSPQTKIAKYLAGLNAVIERWMKLTTRWQ